MMFLLDARKALSLILELNLILFCLSLSDPKVFKHGKASANKSFWAQSQLLLDVVWCWTGAM
jgi:hypothetical protein